ncbi:MAG: LPS-assembly protein LptD, partial [Verrucomicrobia bacterium]|nr:LPS-assembly protein LptD [Verrucomicrobiota bacterium]
MPTRLLIILCILIVEGTNLRAQDLGPAVKINTLTTNSSMSMDPRTGETVFTGRVQILYENASLTADKVTFNRVTTEAVAEGNVRIERDGAVWTGERIQYAFASRKIQAELFRAGQSPLFIKGEKLEADPDGRKYVAENASVTTDNYSEPGYFVRAKRITMVPGEYIRADGATVQIGSA